MTGEPRTPEAMKADAERYVGRNRWASHHERTPHPSADDYAADVLTLGLMLEEAREENERLRAAVLRRVEDDDALEGGLCDCAWCDADRQLLAAAGRERA